MSSFQGGVSLTCFSLPDIRSINHYSSKGKTRVTRGLTLYFISMETDLAVLHICMTIFSSDFLAPSLCVT